MKRESTPATFIPLSRARNGVAPRAATMSWFYMAMNREPVVIWSCAIGFVGACHVLRGPAARIPVFLECCLPPRLRLAILAGRRASEGFLVPLRGRRRLASAGGRFIAKVDWRVIRPAWESPARPAPPVFSRPSPPSVAHILRSLPLCSFRPAGMALPVVVPPIRDMFSAPNKVPPPPSPHAVVKAMHGRA